MKAGSEGFPSDLGAWTYLGTKALGQKPYTPDFDAEMVPGGPCRVLRIKAEAYHAALRMAKADEIMGARAMKQARTASEHVPGRPPQLRLRQHLALCFTDLDKLINTRCRSLLSSSYTLCTDA